MTNIGNFCEQISNINPNIHIRGIMNLYLNSMKSPSVVRLVDILKALGDDKSLQVFCTVANGEDNQTLKNGKGLSRKQYYAKTTRMMKAGLIKRKNSRFSLTTLGIIVYHFQMDIDSAVKNYWKLKAIDSIKASQEMNKEVRAKIVKTIISDETIENILDKQIVANGKVE